LKAIHEKLYRAVADGSVSIKW